jgi:hypothetical protein
VGKVERDRKIQERSAAQLPSQRLMKKTYVDGLDARIAASGSCIEFDITFLLVLCYRCIVQSMLVTRMSIICASGIVSMKNEILLRRWRTYLVAAIQVPDFVCMKCHRTKCNAESSIVNSND